MAKFDLDLTIESLVFAQIDERTYIDNVLFDRVPPPPLGDVFIVLWAQ